jgi:hypothetical protein
MSAQNAHGPTRQRIRRFSQGMELLPESPSKSRQGHFCAGMERLPESLNRARRARFSRGIEQLRVRPGDLHVEASATALPTRGDSNPTAACGTVGQPEHP